MFLLQESQKIHSLIIPSGRTPVHTGFLRPPAFPATTFDRGEVMCPLAKHTAGSGEAAESQNALWREAAARVDRVLKVKENKHFFVAGYRTRIIFHHEHRACDKFYSEASEAVDAARLPT
ncbi:uncharacterized protein LOC144067371 [Stigmatopora argus]